MTLLLHLTLIPQPLTIVIQDLGCLVMETGKETVVDLIDWESGVELLQHVNVSYIKCEMIISIMSRCYVVAM